MNRKIIPSISNYLFSDSIIRTQAGLLDTIGSILKPDLNEESKAFNPFQLDVDTHYGRARDWRNPWVNRRNPVQEEIGNSDPTMTQSKRIPTLFSSLLLKGMKDMENKGTNTENVTEPAATKTIGIETKDEAVDSSTAKAEEVKVLKPLKKKKFYYQVQPVVPEGESTGISDTIYYVD